MKSFARQSAVSHRRRLFVTGLLMLPVLLPGCSRNDEVLLGRAIPVKPSQVLSGRPLSGRMFIIGISLPPQDDFYRAARIGMEAAAADNEVALDLQFAEPASDSQRRQATQLIDKKVNALIAWPTNADVATNVVKAADAAGTPVFTIGVASPQSSATAHFVTVTPLIGLTPEQIGRTAVDRVAAYLRGEKLKPRIVIR